MADEIQPVTASAQNCPWCSAPLASPDLERCPSCAAILTGDSPESLPGVTAVDVSAIARGTPTAVRPRNRLLSWISGDYPEDAPSPTEAQALAPPDPAVKREMLRLELEGEVANLKATADALVAEGAEGRSSAAIIPHSLKRRGGGGAALISDDEMPTPADRHRRTGAAGAPPDGQISSGASCRPPLSCRVPSSPSPGPSFIRRHEVRIESVATSRGWVAHPTGRRLVADDPVGRRSDGVIPFPTAPDSGPPADPPLARLGPAVAGALSGLILEDAGRLQLRLGAVVPPDDPDRPWRAPLVIRAAFRFEPARAATMRPNELAETVLAGFRRAVEGLHRP
jgi:hypothetical protein